MGSNSSLSPQAAAPGRVADREHEIKVTTAWAQHMDARPPSLSASQVGKHEVWLIENLLTANECTELIARAEEHGFGGTDYEKSYRGNLRLITDDQSLADVVWERLRPYVPASLAFSGAQWEACGLNEVWRLAKYHPGDVFGQHVDANFQRSGDEMSMCTVNIYMNDGFTGGSTRFYFKDQQFSVVPKPGLCLIFRQPPGKQYLHDGEMVHSGVKFLFRSDVMYRVL